MMREYIKPQIEIIPTAMLTMAGGVSNLNNEEGEGQFTNTSEFESDLTQIESKSLWED